MLLLNKGLHLLNQINRNMATTIKYKGAYLSEPINGKRNYILVMWSNGSQQHLMFGQLKFHAQRAAVEQGFTKQSMLNNNPC